MKCVLEFSLQDYKQKSTDFFKLLLDEFLNLHLVRSFHNSDLRTSIVIDMSIIQLCILFFVFLQYTLLSMKYTIIIISGKLSILNQLY